MRWYDIFSNFYDRSLENVYGESRSILFQRLKTHQPSTILDLACGTGANFPHIKEHLPDASVYAVDLSTGMLRRAQDHISLQAWDNIHLQHMDVTAINEKILEDFGWPCQYDAVVCTLGLSVLPQWGDTIGLCRTLLKSGGHFVAMDVRAYERTFHTWLVERIAGADLSSPIRERLQATFNHVDYFKMPVAEKRVGGELFGAICSLREYQDESCRH